MHEIWSGGGSGPSASQRANAGLTKNSFIDVLGNRFKAASAAGVYRDIDNAYSAGGSHGSGSPQSTGSIVNRYGGLIPTPTPVKKSGPKRFGSSGSSGGYAPSVSSGSAKKTWDYYEAPLAEKYHFGKETAYQEALANTAFRREMSDMRKAGINPSVYYGSHSSSGAESNIYPREASSGSSVGYGGSGGYSRRSRGGNSGKYVFSGGAYYGIMAATALITSVATESVGAGMAAAGIAGTAMKAINGFFKK